MSKGTASAEAAGALIAAAILVALALVPITLTSILRGFVLASLWTWLVVPLGAPAIGIAHAVGFSIMVGLLTADIARESQDDTKSSSARLASMTVKSVSYSLAAWAIGDIAHSFM